MPDFLIRRASRRTLVLEIKGEESEHDCVKRFGAWVQAVNEKGGFAVWCADAVRELAQMQSATARHVAGDTPVLCARDQAPAAAAMIRSVLSIHVPCDSCRKYIFINTSIFTFQFILYSIKPWIHAFLRR